MNGMAYAGLSMQASERGVWSVVKVYHLRSVQRVMGDECLCWSSGLDFVGQKHTVDLPFVRHESMPKKLWLGKKCNAFTIYFTIIVWWVYILLQVHIYL